MSHTVLVVDDEPGIRRILVSFLRASSYDTVEAASGREALTRFRAAIPDIVLLDIGLPDVDGLEVLRQMRMVADVPTLLVTARAEEMDTIIGLSVGADDYITKPFSMRELVARVKSVLRRTEQSANTADDVLSVNGLVIDLGRHTVAVNDREVTLSPQEFALLECLARHPGRAMSREVLLQQAWNESEYIDPRTVDVHVRWVRGKIETEPSQPTRILTVRGVGYKLAE